MPDWRTTGNTLRASIQISGDCHSLKAAPVVRACDLETGDTQTVEAIGAKHQTQ
ncbi:MAG: hypothetical protein R3A46_19335 [Thermomicrobiales bacterium]